MLVRGKKSFLKLIFCIYIISEFPTSCRSFNGPHDLDCIIASYMESVCSVDGLSFPGKILEHELADLKDMDLVYVALSLLL